MRRLQIVITLVAALTVMGFTPSQAQQSASHDDAAVQVTAADYALEAPEEIPSGWTTIEFANEGEEPHFLFLARLPEGTTFDDYAGQIVPPFNEVWYALRDDGISPEEAMERLGANVPEWYWTVEFMGGAGIIPPDATSQVTLNLKPGTYALECYMKTEDGEMHSMEGMIRELTVTDTPSDAAPPEADIQITLSNFEMAIDGNLTPGSHTVSVHVAENPEEGFGHNVHVARLEPNTDAQDVVRWMNFFDPNGLRTPSPFTFLGGVQLMPVGATGYFTLDLEPGRYLFVSEYTAPFGVYQEVSVEP